MFLSGVVVWCLAYLKLLLHFVNCPLPSETCRAQTFSATVEYFFCRCCQCCTRDVKRIIIMTWSDDFEYLQWSESSELNKAACMSQKPTYFFTAFSWCVDPTLRLSAVCHLSKEKDKGAMKGLPEANAENYSLSWWPHFNCLSLLGRFTQITTLKPVWDSALIRPTATMTQWFENNASLPHFSTSLYRGDEDNRRPRVLPNGKSVNNNNVINSL